MQALVLGSSVTHLKFGETVWNDSGTKSAMVLDSDYQNNIHLLNLVGGEWTTGDKYVDLVDNKHADGAYLYEKNATFLATEAYHKFVVDESTAPTGVQATVIARLTQLANDIAYNLKHGGNDKVHD